MSPRPSLPEPQSVCERLDPRDRPAAWHGGGFLGTAFGPLLVQGDPATPCYGAEACRLPEGLARERLGRREAMLRSLEAGPGGFHAQAFDLLRSDAVRRALDVTAEPHAVRERYGLGWHGSPYVEDASGGALDSAQQLRGQNLLVARWLVEVGVPFVSVYDNKVQGASRDTHNRNSAKLKGHLLPPADQALSALVEDLDAAACSTRRWWSRWASSDARRG
jgi:hypothetical protein